MFHFDLNRILQEGLYGIDWNGMQGNVLILSLIILLVVSLIKKIKKQTIDVFLMNQTILFRWGVIIILFFMVIIFGEYGQQFDAQQFVYFQF